jgi:hypothetical protein
LGSANIAEHEAIAATQAAIWFLTNGLALDTRPLNVPVSATTSAGAWTFEFDGEPQLGGYSLSATSKHPATVRLQKSVDGTEWHDVATSRLSIDAGRDRYSKTLGVGATVSSSGRGPTRGHRFYRLVVDADRSAGLAVVDVRFWLHDSRNYRNAERVVALYEYLLAGAREARRRAVSPELDVSDATVDGETVGPFRLQVTDNALVTASGRHAIVDGDGAEVVGAIEPGREFFLRSASGSSAATITATVPGTPNGFGGRVLTGVARDEVGGGLTPVALTVPTRLVIDFDIRWNTTARSFGVAS